MQVVPVIRRNVIRFENIDVRGYITEPTPNKNN